MSANPYEGTDRPNPHERITITKQRQSWRVVAALREFYEDYQEDPDVGSITAEAEPALRGVENALGLTGDERSTDPLGMEIREPSERMECTCGPNEACSECSPEDKP